METEKSTSWCSGEHFCTEILIPVKKKNDKTAHWLLPFMEEKYEEVKQPQENI